MTVRVGVVVSHPIQHFCPQYASWAALPGIDLRVFFASKIGVESYYDPDFGREVAWQGLTMAFDHVFLPGAAERTQSAGIDAPELGPALREFGPDVLIVYGYAARLQRRAIGWGRRHGVPLAMISDAELRSKRPFTRRVAKGLILPQTLRAIDAFLTVGDANEAYYRRYGADPKTFYRAGFPIDVASYDLALIDRASRRAALRRRLGLPEDRLVLLTVGKLIGRKRQADLVTLARRLPEVTVVLAGSGPDEDTLRAQAADGTIFAGFVQPSELIDYYLAADVYMHPAEADPHPLSVTEATYCGCPAIVSDRIGSHGPGDDIQPGINGYVHPVGDVAAMATAVGNLSDPDLRAEMSRASLRISRTTQERAHGVALLDLIKGLGLAV